MSKAEAINTPFEPGSFVGDIYFGHPLKSTMGTHRWSGSEWVALPSVVEALADLLADARAERDANGKDYCALMERYDALVVNNDRLRKALEDVIADCEADYPPSHGAIKYAAKLALKGESHE